ncbi:TPA: alpha-galactosidase [Candidatus Poribacteria bacterium]|nr:alpha-galactosidase [Candidatus Poribacteria bacterium]
MEDNENWLISRFTKGVIPPFSFIYDGKPSSSFIKDWRFEQGSGQIDDVKKKHIFTYVDTKTGLRIWCKCETFLDFPAIEWVLTFENSGSEDTPIIEDIQAIDTIWNYENSGEVILHRALGSSASRSDFAPVDDIMQTNNEIKLTTVGGRSSNTTVFPFFNIEAPGEGLMLAIGWSGQWTISFMKNEENGVKIRSGMELTHLKLRKGEKIRTPRILLLFWEGEDRMIGHNTFRQFMLKHHTLHRDDKPVTAPLASSGGPACQAPLPGFEEFNKATEHNQIALAERYRQFGLDTEYFWIDAGWYEGHWPNGVGNWFPRKDGFPNGLRAVSDALAKLDFKLLVWFEPERVHQGTWIDREHPEWVLKLPGNPNGLLNLGNPEALKWLTDHISGMIEKEGISLYRQDFNIDPLPFWRAYDEPDRQGITEIRYIEGLYAFWDELLARKPDLVIDNCASGGRRIDLETSSRSIPLWRTDYHYFEPNGYQCHTYGINFYLPTSSTGNGYPDTYSFRSSINSGVVLGWNLYLPDFPVEKARKLIAEFKKIRPLFYGDYYPLTAYSIEDDVWMAYQFHREDMKQGMIMAFRRPKCQINSINVKLKGLSPESNYKVTFEDDGTTKTISGKDLMSGIDLTISDAGGSLLITYSNE